MEGDQVILLRQGGEPKIVHQFNTHLAGVREAKKILLNRREPGEDEDRNDWLLLPPDHKPGERHPLLVYFYPDKRYGKELRGDDLRDFSFVNMNIPTARGYAVLLASMKISDLGKAIGNPMREMHEQLIRAAENAVAKGYVYSDRWAIMGHSYGGYGTNSVITQTGRFKAAISMNGLSNLSSGYGIGMNQDKAFAVPEGLNFGALWSEGGQGRMGVAPWQDPQRYVDNSPVFWAHQITTPLMLIHGDQDFVNINEAEQLFAALYRQGKDAQLLRYWGEGHEYSSPGNITDMWERIFVFLDENLNKSAAPTFHGLGQAPSAIN
jgi:dipeptidyl aminopeptidase/acylaminoacyl peptidase